MMLTLTLRKRDGDLRQEVKRARRAWREFYSQTIWSKLGRTQRAGAISSIEISPSCMVHLHVLVFGPFIPQASLSRLWKQVTGDSFVVDIREVRRPTEGLTEVVKYISKFKDIGPDFCVKLLLALNGHRRLSTHGLFYNMPVAELLEKEDFWCDRCGAGRYRFLCFEPIGGDDAQRKEGNGSGESRAGP